METMNTESVGPPGVFHRQQFPSIPMVAGVQRGCQLTDRKPTAAPSVRTCSRSFHLVVNCVCVHTCMTLSKTPWCLCTGTGSCAHTHAQRAQCTCLNRYAHITDVCTHKYMNTNIQIYTYMCSDTHILQIHILIHIYILTYSTCTFTHAHIHSHVRASMPTHSRARKIHV